MQDSLASFMGYALYIGVPLVFIGIVLYVYRPWARKRYQKDAEIPFADEKDKHNDK